uniref:peptidylprolyl isomerase n=1 Tax=Hemiselmis andersenii TaxID=464988 RepID=A0A6U4XM18_HEMAN|mmetsp:Transcript_36028/g.87688  ORF Transcript_36028/g.87688 Transcript_36028/m.87688 type:complete len:331 (+) Transcript_36028:72-1064(+)
MQSKFVIAVACILAALQLTAAFHLPSLPTALSATSSYTALSQIPRLRSPACSSLLNTRKRVQSLPALRMMAEEKDDRTVQDGDVVGVTYKGTFDDGEVFDQNEGQPLLEFEVGSGRVIKGFDKAVYGLKIGESREVRCEASEAYGEYDDDNVAVVPIDQMPDPPEGMKMEPGMVMQLATGQIAVIKKVTDDDVTLDGNHPLAGKTLHFKVTLGSIMDREAAQKAKVTEMETVLGNPLLALVAADVLKDKEYISGLKAGLEGAEDKGQFINTVLASPEWRTINDALMQNPELLKLVRDPDALEKMAASMPSKDGSAEQPSKVVEVEFDKDE